MNPFLALVLVATADPAGGVDQDWANKARAALPGLIERRLQLSAHLDEVNERLAAPQPGAPAGSMSSRFGTTIIETSRHGRDLLVKTTTKPDDGSEEETLVLCRNEYYNFKLTKKGADGKYVLVAHSNDPPKGDWEAGRCAHLMMINPMRQFLKALESQDQHVLRHLAWDAKRSLVVAEYEARHDDPKRVFEYRCLFDPVRGWAPVEAVTKTWAGKFETRYDYGFDIEGLAFPSAEETKMSYHVTPAPQASVMRYEIHSLGPSHTTERDFRLTAFGLPEPTDAPPLPRSGLPTYVYILVGAAVCAALSLLFRHFAKRTQKVT
jgi:hypothetical protein